MRVAQQNFNYSLECVWKLSERGLTCVWVARARAAEQGCRKEDVPDPGRRVA